MEVEVVAIIIITKAMKWVTLVDGDTDTEADMKVATKGTSELT